MKKFIGFVAALTFFFLIGNGSALAATDKNCSDFSTWKEAQDFFEENGGPGEDPYNLDRDKDGLACETLSGFDPNYNPGSGDDSQKGEGENKEEGGEMPETAMSLNGFLLGGIFFLAGAALFVFNRRFSRE
ncbi:excalibur calcium-binding domain-containing protein [Paludifilum halophilum]|uniref:Excalibur calcium-binding domain-containing protein n=1 Tax=Paludifilum halophilum TaxID=1642702 RepID=A0A235BA64_9BACL|nr:excalibur calcium-binding domain-containing protein [Paludifilum halophilum]OYD08777.1 hypothetical protein CHM34_02990 [Paludifilum halophilum]